MVIWTVNKEQSPEGVFSNAIDVVKHYCDCTLTKGNWIYSHEEYINDMDDDEIHEWYD